MVTLQSLGIESKTGFKQGLNSTTCPKCSDSRKPANKNKPCLTVHLETGNTWFKCHNDQCGYAGNIDHMNKAAAMYKASRMPEKPAVAYSVEMRSFIQSKGIFTRTLLEDRVYEIKNDIFHCMAVPFFSTKGLSLRNVKFRNILWNKESTTPKFWQIKETQDVHRESCFLGLHRLNFDTTNQDENVLYITEGETDRWTLLQCGYENVLSIPMGAPDPRSKNFNKEFAYANEDKDFKNNVLPFFNTIIILADNDAAGATLKEHLPTFLGKTKCKYVTYPEGYKDVNEVFNGNNDSGLKGLGEDGIAKLINESRFFPIEGLIGVDYYREDIVNRTSKGLIHGLGINDSIDRIYKVSAPFIAAITGCPFTGKSALMNWHNVEFTKQHSDERMAMFVPEDRPLRVTFEKLIQLYWKMPIHQLSTKQINEALDYLDATFRMIQFGTEKWKNFDQFEKSLKTNSMRKIMNYLEICHSQFGITGWRIDPWNKIDHERPSHITETNYIGSMLDMLIAFNEYFGLWGQIVTHPHVMETEKSGNFKVPTLYDINGGANWFNKIDNGLVIQRDLYGSSGNRLKETTTIIHSKKAKHDGTIGYLGEVKKYMHPELGRIFQDQPPMSKEDQQKSLDLDDTHLEKVVKKSQDIIDQYSNDAEFMTGTIDPEDLPF